MCVSFLRRVCRHNLKSMIVLSNKCVKCFTVSFLAGLKETFADIFPFVCWTLLLWFFTDTVFVRITAKMLIINDERLLRPSASSRPQVIHRWVSWRHTGSGQRTAFVTLLLSRCSNFADIDLLKGKRGAQQRDVHFWWVILRCRVIIDHEKRLLFDK